MSKRISRAAEAHVPAAEDEEFDYSDEEDEEGEEEQDGELDTSGRLMQPQSYNRSLFELYRIFLNILN
jgi:hypothetical protein